MNLAYNSEAPKRATNLSINSDLLKKAKSYNINLSKNFEIYLNELVKKHEEEAWKLENMKAIEAHNERVEKHGVFSDGLRRF
ncbi:MAG TPA: acetoacetyl-CoA synthase [Campylobacterales bacterium]|nr:acetoacetyl-CoA synthase [Campylobacterales bacterium]